MKGRMGLTWAILAAIYWIACALAVARLLRGRSAEKRGVAPTFPREFVRTPWSLYLWLWAGLAMFMVVMSSFEIWKGHERPRELYFPLMCLSTFLAQLPNYLRSRIQRNMQSYGTPLA